MLDREDRILHRGTIFLCMVALTREPGGHVQLQIGLLVYLVGWLQLGPRGDPHFMKARCQNVFGIIWRKGSKGLGGLGMWKWIYLVKPLLSSAHHIPQEGPEHLPLVKELRNAGARGDANILEKLH